MQKYNDIEDRITEAIEDKAEFEESVLHWIDRYTTDMNERNSAADNLAAELAKPQAERDNHIIDYWRGSIIFFNNRLAGWEDAYNTAVAAFNEAQDRYTAAADEAESYRTTLVEVYGVDAVDAVAPKDWEQSEREDPPALPPDPARPKPAD